MKLSFVKGKMGVVIKGDYYNVKRLPESNDELEVDVAYVVGNNVLPFMGNSVDINDEKDYGLFMVDGVLLARVPTDTDYSTDNIIVLDISKVIDKVQAEGFLSPEEIERINMASEFKSYPISPDDDFLKVLVKTVINLKKINPKVYASRLPKKHKMSNMINALTGDTMMSMRYFLAWKELLEIDFDITVRDSYDSTLPIDSTIYLDSADNEPHINKKKQ